MNLFDNVFHSDTILEVPLGRGYQVTIGKDVLARLGGQLQELLPRALKAAVVTDDRVAALHLEKLEETLTSAGFEVLTRVIPAGEASKSQEKLFDLLGFWAQKGLTGSDVVIAFGGGVVGDLAGLGAALYLRGVPLVQVPTTLLAMVDSSVGGKTAIDLPEGKNLVGAFYQPQGVFCDTDLLDTLAPSEWADGYSEVIKYGMLGNYELLVDLNYNEPSIQEIISTCVAMKRDIVMEDEFDQGIRQLLNFGHTIGHAIEKLSGYQISHGQAVAMGMALDTRAAAASGYCPPESLQLLMDLLAKYQLPSSCPYDVSQLFLGAGSDKKRKGSVLTHVVPAGLGICRLEPVAMENYLDWIKKGGQES